MMRLAVRISFALCVVNGMLLTAALGAEPGQPSVEELKFAVMQREREFSAAQVALASTRARLARAEGNVELAAAEGRKVLVHCEGVLRELNSSRGCPTYEYAANAQRDAFVARIWLAEVEGRRDVLITELPKYIAFHEGRMQRYQNLVLSKAILQKDGEAAVKESDEELRRARERLAALQGGSVP